MLEDPTNTRHQFYLAQSYFDSQQWEKSDEAYRKRVEMGGWEEEVFYSLYRIAMIAAITNKTFGEIKEKFLMAWNYRPIRAEPLYQIAKMYRLVNQPRLAYLYASMAKTMPYPKFDILFIDEDVYRWQCDDEIAATSFYLHKYDEGIAACESLLKNPSFPNEERPRMEANLANYKVKMQEMGGVLQAMRDMEGQKPVAVPSPTETMLKQQEDEVAKRKRLEMLLDRNKNKKKFKTRR
jgi:hypothetical protein